MHAWKVFCTNLLQLNIQVSSQDASMSVWGYQRASCLVNYPPIIDFLSNLTFHKEENAAHLSHSQMREHIPTHTDSSPVETAHKHRDNTDIHTGSKAESPVGVQGRLVVRGVLHNNLLLSGWQKTKDRGVQVYSYFSIWLIDYNSTVHVIKTLSVCVLFSRYLAINTCNICMTCHLLAIK